MTQEKSVKLHLGCGRRYLPGYVHIDFSDYPHIDHRGSVADLSMFEDMSVDLIYASHVLEYFTDIESFTVLNEWQRKLRLGGILRLAVPDFDALMLVKQRTNNIDLISGPLLGIWEISPGNKIQHKCVYDYAKLSNRLFAINFKTIRSWNWREIFVGELSGFDDYSQAYIPHMDKQNGIAISLNIEAVK